MVWNKLGIWRIWIRIRIQIPFSILFWVVIQSRLAFSNLPYVLKVLLLNKLYSSQHKYVKFGFHANHSYSKWVLPLERSVNHNFSLFYHSLGTNSVLELRLLRTLTQVVKGFGVLGPRINFTCQKENRRFCRPKITQCWCQFLQICT